MNGVRFHRRWRSFGSTTSLPPSLLQAGCMRLSTRLNFERIRTSEVNSEILMQLDEAINVTDCVL